MATKSGTNATAKIGSTTIANLANWTISDNTEALEAPVFGDTNNKVHGMGTRKVSGSVSGYLDVDDTNGQEALNSAYTDRTSVIDFRLYIDATTYYSPDTVTDTDACVYITSVNISAAQNEIIPVEFTFVVSGAWTRT